MDRWGWIAAVGEPTFLALLTIAVGMPYLLFPGTLGLLMAALAAGLVFWLDHRLEESVRRLPVRVGPEALLGQIAEVIETLEPMGMVNCDGEGWRASEVQGRRVERGERVAVVGIRGLVLEVDRLPEAD